MWLRKQTALSPKKHLRLHCSGVRAACWWGSGWQRGSKGDLHSTLQVVKNHFSYWRDFSFPPGLTRSAFPLTQFKSRPGPLLWDLHSGVVVTSRVRTEWVLYEAQMLGKRRGPAYLESRLWGALAPMVTGLPMDVWNSPYIKALSF